MTKRPPVDTDARSLLHLVRAGELDAALESGLMAWSAQADDGLDESEHALLASTCQRLRKAWAARERHQARQTRLQRRERERQERRAPPANAPTPASGQLRPSPPALPVAAAAILARARARAGIAPQ